MTQDMPEVIYLSKQFGGTVGFEPFAGGEPYIRKNIVTPEAAKRMLDQLNGFMFSDGPGPVCKWVNENQGTLRALLKAHGGV